MNIERKQEVVHQFHYDARNLAWEEENGTPETALNVQFQLVDQVEDYGAEDTAINSLLTFLIVLETIVISGSIEQQSIIRGQIIENQEQLSQEGMSEIANPLFDILQRITYEVTEIALDQPGINLEF